MRTITEPQSFPDGSRVIHIGLPKTGTSSLQASFDAGRDALLEQGVRYAVSGRHQLAAVRAGLGALEQWRSKGKRLAEWEDLCARVRESDARLTLLSSETFSAASPEVVPRITGLLGDNLEVVVTLRPLASLLSSLWQQSLYRRGTESLEEWLRRRLGPEAEPRESVLQRQSLPRILRDWGPAVGERAITFVIADPSDRSSTRTTFERLLGIDPGTLPETAWGNASLPYPEAELLRQFSRAYTARGGRDALWLMAIRANARYSFAQLSLPPHPIELPRWAAERCNELTARWVDGVAESDVAFVGSLDHLYVDLATAPASVPAPTQVGIQSAGAMFDAVFEATRFVAGRRAGTPASADLTTASTRELLAELGRRGLPRPRGK